MKKESTVKNVLAELEHLESRINNLFKDISRNSIRIISKSPPYHVVDDYVKESYLKVVDSALIDAAASISKAGCVLKSTVKSKMLK